MQSAGGFPIMGVAAGLPGGGSGPRLCPRPISAMRDLLLWRALAPESPPAEDLAAQLEQLAERPLAMPKIWQRSNDWERAEPTRRSSVPAMT